MQRVIPTMKQVHVRNIFQLVVPVTADVSRGFTFKQSTTPSFGITLTREETSEHYHYEIQVKLCDEIEAYRRDVFIWAKRNALQLVTTPNTTNIEAMVLGLKIDEKTIRFGNLKSKTIRFVVNYFSSGVFLKQGASEECLLLPRRRLREDSEEAPSIPIYWADYTHSDEDYQRSSGDNWSPQDAEEDSVMFALDQENNPNEHNSSYNSASNHNEFSDSEQYIVLYDGNAEVVGNFRALNFYKASDVKLKEDIRLLTEDRDCRQVLLKIDGVEYKFKDGVSHTTNKRFIGYIAQQIESVVPAAVQLIDGILHVDYESLIPYLSESIKQNFSDISHLQSKTDKIEEAVNLMYAEFIRKEHKHSNESYKRKKSDHNAQIFTPKLRRWIIGILLVVTIMTAGTIGIFFALNQVPNTPNSPVVTPTAPNSPDPKSPVTSPFISVPLPSGSQVNVSRTDISILEEFYNATDGPNWVTEHIEGAPWLTAAVSKCQWKGVKCDTSHLIIIEINLANCNLSGTIPSTIGELQLQSLDLSRNSLHGSIPATIGNMTSLLMLNFSENNLTGTIPPTVFQLKNLIRLLLGRNNFTEYTLPNTIIVDLPKIFELDLSKTNLFGPIPDKLLNHPKLGSLNLRENKLDGTLPAIGSQLLTLDLSFNQLEGTLKLTSQRTNIFSLLLSNNNFNGTIDNIFPLDLRALILANNQFSGTFSVSSQILDVVDISGNHFTAVDEQNLRYLSQIPECNMAHNDWKCPLPMWMTELCKSGQCTNEEN